jgi:hypothetical protein
MKKEDVQFLSQLVKSLEDAELKLESANNKKDYNEFRKIKRFMLDIQKKIGNIIR